MWSFGTEVGILLSKCTVAQGGDLPHDRGDGCTSLHCYQWGQHQRFWAHDTFNHEKNVRTWLYIVRTKQMCFLSYGICLCFILIWTHVVFTCLHDHVWISLLYPHIFFYHGQNKLHACCWTQGQQFLIVSTGSLKQGSKTTWMLEHCASHPKKAAKN